MFLFNISWESLEVYIVGLYLLFLCRLRTDSVLNQNTQRLKEGPVIVMNMQYTAGPCRFAVTHRHAEYVFILMLYESHKTCFSPQDFTRLNKDTMTGRSLCLMSPSPHQKQTVTVTAFLSSQTFSPQGPSFVRTVSVDV